jgi:hypothetical protein
MIEDGGKRLRGDSLKDKKQKERDRIMASWSPEFRARYKKNHPERFE